MTRDTERLCFTLEAGLDEEGDGPPEEVQVLPYGDVSPKGKTRFIVDEVSMKEILDAFGRSETDLVVDYEHQSLSGSEAPAAGWVRELFDRGADGLWAKVEWTARAAEYIRNREYRYISPVVLIRKSDGRAVELLGAALTNLPAIDGMEPVAGSAVCSACGRTADAQDSYACMYKGVIGLLGLPDDAGVEAAEAAIELLKAPDGFVPESEFAALRERLADAEAETLIREAMTDGRLTPALASWARSYARADLDGFREFLGRACRVVPVSGVAAGESRRVDASQDMVNSLLGISEEQFARYARTGI